jgi:hypothetical protein
MVIGRKVRQGFENSVIRHVLVTHFTPVMVMLSGGGGDESVVTLS